MTANNHILPHLHGAEYRRCLTDLDVQGMRRLHHAATGKELSDSEALAAMHYARTHAGSVQLKLRAYSHAWLVERSLPSGLPDELKSFAERLYPREVTAVGIAVGTLSGVKTPVAKILEAAMSNAVSEMYADGVTEPTLVKSKMLEAYRRAKKQL
jgi:hypothetical protein